MTIFPFADYWWLYVSFTLAIFVILLIDLGIFHKEDHEVSFKEASIWSGVWVTLALLFNLGLYLYLSERFSSMPPDELIAGMRAADIASIISLEFLTGYIVEYSLSVDNIFVFVVVFNYFAIPKKYQHRILFFGILGALIFRAIFIALGAKLLEYEMVNTIFGAFLVFTGIKIMFTPEMEQDLSKSIVYRGLKKLFPITQHLHGKKFFVREGGKLLATPLFVTLVVIEFTDIVFAIDSVPAIFAITKEPFIVFTSNMCAIMGLRSMYFLLMGSVDKFHLLKYGLGIVLTFVGLKMTYLNDLYGGKFPIVWSLAIITGTIGLSIVLSLVFKKSHTDHS